MSEFELRGLHESTAITTLVRQVDTFDVARRLGAQGAALPENALSTLRVAAMASFADVFGPPEVDDLLRQFTNGQATEPRRMAVRLDTFHKWSAYLDAKDACSQVPDVEDLLFFSAVGLAARQLTEVRGRLQRFARADDPTGASFGGDWERQVRGCISQALVFLVRQGNADDVDRAATLIRRVGELQPQFEPSWLANHESRGTEQRAAVTLLGLYNLAHAVVRTAEYLRNGTVPADDGRALRDFASELRALLVRAEEFLRAAAAIELLQWLEAVAVVLWRVRADSIWASAGGVSDRLDKLLVELTRAKDQSTFTLLPSQHDALRLHLLDARSTAIVLQMPTSSGKTLLAEFAIVQALEAYKGTARVAYIVPTRALAAQTRRRLAQSLRPLGVSVVAASGAFEDSPFEFEMLSGSATVIVATPEKLDLLLRAHSDWTADLRLIVVDEAHLLKEAERGVRLELLLANLRREHPETRLLLLTPFVDNAKAIAAWLAAERGVAINVEWRPSRLLLGLTTFVAPGKKKRGEPAQNARLRVEWLEPHAPWSAPEPVEIEATRPQRDLKSGLERIVELSIAFRRVGPILAFFSAERADAEQAAKLVAATMRPLEGSETSPALRVAIALAEEDYGEDSILATCLRRGAAYHHAALSSVLRGLIEDEVRTGRIRFIAATATLAQGMNFPVSAILIHSIHKPYGKGNLSPSEFWNIAGRSGRVGLADRGYVIFTNPDHREHWTAYANERSESLRSALLAALKLVRETRSLKDLYARVLELRPFIQYLAHSAARTGVPAALRELEELLQASLANAQASGADEARQLRAVARRYLEEISAKPQGYLQVADQTGLGSFSFDTLFAFIKGDSVLKAGPTSVLGGGVDGMLHLVSALRTLPEMDLGVTQKPGGLDSDRVARIIRGWIDGKSTLELSGDFPGAEPTDRVRNANTYLHRTVSQNVAWGAHAYLRGWSMSQGSRPLDLPADASVLPTYIQHGVHTPEAAVASLLSVPRVFAEGIGSVYRDRVGAVTPSDVPKFRAFVEKADAVVWRDAISRSSLKQRVDPEDVRVVWRDICGMN